MAGLANARLPDEANDVMLPEPEKPSLTQVGRDIQAYFNKDQPVEPAQSREGFKPTPETKAKPAPVKKVEIAAEPVPTEKHGTVLNSMRRLITDFGMPPHRAAAVLGNGAHESDWFRNLDEDKSKYTKGKGGYGWMQWTDNEWEPRRANFVAYAKANKLKPSSDKANYGYLAQELQQNPRYLASMRNAHDVDAATEKFMNSYERPNSAVSHLESRQAKARGILKLYGEKMNPRLAMR
jgi:Phage tail lysozyme